MLNSKGLSCLLSEKGVTMFCPTRDREFYSLQSLNPPRIYFLCYPGNVKALFVLLFKHCPDFSALSNAAMDKHVLMKRIYLFLAIWTFRVDLWGKC